MLELNKRKNINDSEEIVVGTNQGEFIVSQEENEGIYIGFIESDPEIKAPIEFRITKENYDIYQIFDKLFNNLRFVDFNNKIPQKLNSVTLLSDDFKPEESSSLTIRENKDSEDLSLIFSKSKSDKWKDTYFVKLTNIEFMSAVEYQVFSNFIEELKSYSPKNRQIHIEEYLYKQRSSKQRTRMKLSGKH